MKSDGTFVAFAIGSALFALPVDPVREILDARSISPLPRSPAHLLGLIDRRGTSVPVVDLRRLLGQDDREDAPDTRIIVLGLGSNAEEGYTIGLRVDRVTEVTALDHAGSAPLAEAELVRWNERMVAGIGRRNGAFVTVIDVDGLLTGELADIVPAQSVA